VFRPRGLPSPQGGRTPRIIELLDQVRSREQQRVSRRAGQQYPQGYVDESPVGFVMIADEVDSSEYIPHYLWKLLIDERYQRRGLGTATLDLIVEYFPRATSSRRAVDERRPGRR
jgi:diamine N-acetyltransferase